MEIDDDDEEWATLNHRENSTEVIESGSGVATEVAMDMGNPWDSKPLAASTTVPFDNPFESSSPGPKSAEGWANFSAKDGDSEMSPVKNSGSGEFGAFLGQPTIMLKPQKNHQLQVHKNHQLKKKPRRIQMCLCNKNLY